MSKRTMPVKTGTLDFSEDGYPDFHAEARTNVPPRLLKRYLELLQGNLDGETEAREILLEVFPSWDFVDGDGKAIPHTVDGFEEIPPDLVTAMMVRRGKAIQEAAMPGPLGNDSSKTDSPPPTDSQAPKEESKDGQDTSSGS